jgi:hypothetical protein
MATEFFGWEPNPQGVEDYINDPRNKHPVFMVSAHALMRDYEQKDTMLYENLLWADPNYQRGRQLIGDCVSWGCELGCTTNMAKALRKIGRRDLFIPAATESIYGGARVEALRKQSGGWNDGAYGAAAATWVREWGIVQRKDYSAQTGNPEHDLRQYSGQRAKQWGNYGCGGAKDKGKLDELAKEFPVKTTSIVHSFDEIAAAIAGAKVPVTIASNYGTDMRRDKNGFCRWNASWGHQMVLIAVRFGARPGALCAQSWGPQVASGPKYPETMPDNIAGFTWWIPAEDCDRIAKQGDSHALGDVEGWKIDPFEWDDVWG